MALLWRRIAKVFMVYCRGNNHCPYCCEKVTIIHNRFGRKVFDYQIRYCFYCGRKLR